MKKLSIIFLIVQTIGYLLIMDLKAGEESSLLPQEKRLKNIRQLTFGWKRLVFISNRNAKQPGEFNIFMADWVP